MDNRALLSPDIKDMEYGYGLAYKLAGEKLAGIDDIEEQCRRCEAVYDAIDARKVITLQFLNRTYQVSLPDIEVVLKDSDEGVPLREKILILHYLTQAKDPGPPGKIIAYKELPEGATYYPTFFKRAVKPVADNFGRQPERLLPAAAVLGACETDYGDVAVTISAFSRVPITFVLWRGDEELAPEGGILFDSTVSDYLTTEDTIVLCEIIAWRLVRILRAGGDNHNR